MREAVSWAINGRFYFVAVILVMTKERYKSKRYIDIGLIDNEENVIIGYQVGVGTKSGLPVAREVRALEDIAKSIGEGKVIFVTYK